MSVLSAQRDKLRVIADKLFDMDYHDYASEVRDAADTIWQLRNDCVDLRMENAKLRELLSMYVTFARAFAEGCILHYAYCDGMGERMDETKMRERAFELGVNECR